MKPNRREFIGSMGLLGVGLALPSHSAAVAKTGKPESENGVTPRKILILGGTGFIGPNMVKYAVERGHEVSIFTRGNKKSETPGVEHLIGDRNDDLSALEGRTWDVVLDNNARDYRWVKLSTEMLKGAVGHYLFVSSISSYQYEVDNSSATGYEFKERVLKKPLMDETYPLNTPIGAWKDGDEAEYGLTKALSEKLAHAAFPGRTTVVRPGLIAGPGDPTNRWSYWLQRVAEGGEILAPGNPEHVFQVIDQRDLTEWIVRLAENETMGDFNAAGPESRMTMNRMLHGIWAATGSDSRPVWVDETFLEKQNVQPWQDMPGWVPGLGLVFVDIGSSINAGLTFRPMAVSARDHLEWELHRPKEGDENNGYRQFGISRDKEKELLAAWKQGQ